MATSRCRQGVMFGYRLTIRRRQPGKASAVQVVAAPEARGYSGTVGVAIRSSDDFLTALREHPEWRDAVRREILTDELLELPATVRALAESQRHTEATLQSFMESTRAFQRSMEEFKRSMEEFKRSMEEFKHSMEEFKHSMEEFKEATEKRFRGIELELDFFVGKSMEADASRKLGNYLRSRVRKLRRLDPDMVDLLIDAALESGRLTEGEGEDLGNADALAIGKALASGKPACVAVEVSKTVDKNDVERAVRRARLFLKASGAAAGLPEWIRVFPEPPEEACALVIGRRITEGGREAAERSGALFGPYKNGHDREGRP